MDHKEIGLAPHPVGLVLQVGGKEKFPQALGFKSLSQELSAEPSISITQWVRVLSLMNSHLLVI